MPLVEKKCSYCGTVNTIEGKNKKAICKLCIKPLFADNEPVKKQINGTIDKQLEYGFATGNPEHFFNVLEEDKENVLANLGLNFFKTVEQFRKGNINEDEKLKLKEYCLKISQTYYNESPAVQLAYKRVGYIK